jgi:hypothetical protein
MDRQMRALKEAIETRYGCACRHAGMAHVKQKEEGGLAWEGPVQTFELIGHPKAKFCYAFTVENSGGLIRQVTAVSPPIKSSEWAVRAYLMQERRRIDAAQSAAPVG